MSERDPNKCWHCGEPLHQGHFCEGMRKKLARMKRCTICEKEIAAQRNQLRAEIATLRDSRDTQKALAQRYWNDLQTARAEIAALTEQRDELQQSASERIC